MFLDGQPGLPRLRNFAPAERRVLELRVLEGCLGYSSPPPEPPANSGGKLNSFKYDQKRNKHRFTQKYIRRKCRKKFH
jgi:hypothetical protein